VGGGGAGEGGGDRGLRKEIEERGGKTTFVSEILLFLWGNPTVLG
jgi:hypothetical protein